MALSRDTRNERKLKKIRRTQFGLKQALERIDWEEDVLLPEIMEFQGRAQLASVFAADVDERHVPRPAEIRWDVEKLGEPRGDVWATGEEADDVAA